MAEPGYRAVDEERFVAETHSSARTAFARDRARVLHSGGWRRLSAKTQVHSPAAGTGFLRNRLTHSLEVAQIGRELAVSLGASPDLVDTACLTHDLGHPPFGHNGERALDEWNAEWGGFEGNAQTLRILSRLEPKRVDAGGDSVGLNLTRATLDASCKYPWTLDEAERGSRKFGVYADDLSVFRWMREGAPHRTKCVEAQIMDLSDDIAYSVHDFEDAIFSGHIDPEFLNSPAGHEGLLEQVAHWSGNQFSIDELGFSFEELSRLGSWPTSWHETRSDQAKLKNLTSDLIGRFAGAAIAHTRESGAARLTRYSAALLVPQRTRVEIAVLKGLVARFVMEEARRQPMYVDQREQLTELLDELWLAAGGLLTPMFAEEFRHATNEATARRVVVDQVASLTDQAAVSFSEWLRNGKVGENPLHANPQSHA